MSISNTRWARFVVLALCAAAAGCSVESGDDSTAANTDPIKGGVAARDFPEAALVNFNRGSQAFICSGAVIAPQVVLTAGHCVAGGSNFQVKAPFANGQASFASSATTFDYTAVSELVDANAHDVGLVFLAQPIQLDRFPTIAESELARGTNVVNIGRIQNGVQSDSALFVSRALPVDAAGARQLGFPFDYVKQGVIEGGDSGGPDFVQGTHTIAAVNSGTLSDGREVIARTDLVAGFIKDQIARHGGPGGGAQPPPTPEDPSTPPDPGTPVEPPSGGGAESFCYALACGGGQTRKCFTSESAYCAGLGSEPTCSAQARQVFDVFCN